MTEALRIDISDDRGLGVVLPLPETLRADGWDVIHLVQIVGGARSNHGPFGIMDLIFAREVGFEREREGRRQ